MATKDKQLMKILKGDKKLLKKAQADDKRQSKKLTALFNG